MDQLPLKREQWNEIAVIATDKTWWVEVALIPTPDYPRGEWKRVYGRKKERSCKGSTSLCVIRMVTDGLTSLAEELSEEWFDPSIFKIVIMVSDSKAANILRGAEVSMAAASALSQFRVATKPFKSYVVWKIARREPITTSPSHARLTQTSS